MFICNNQLLNTPNYITNGYGLADCPRSRDPRLFFFRTPIPHNERQIIHPPILGRTLWEFREYFITRRVIN